MNNQQIVVMEITDPGHAGSATAGKVAARTGVEPATASLVTSDSTVPRQAFARAAQVEVQCFPRYGFVRV